MSLSIINEVLNTIPYYTRKNKRLIRLFSGVGLTFVVVAMVGISSFYLGRIRTYSGPTCPVSIDMAQYTASQTVPEISFVNDMPSTRPQKTEVSIDRAGGVVVSKNGTKYHFPWCPGAGQIKEENKVWYPDESAAQSAGYTKAGNCQ